MDSALALVASQDGRRVAFFGQHQGAEGLYVLDVTSSSIKQASDVSSFAIQLDYQLSADGQFLAWKRSFSDNLNVWDWQTEVNLVVADQVVFRDGYRFAPSGDVLFFARRVGGGGEVHSYSPSQGDQLLFENLDDALTSPALSHDGETLYYINSHMGHLMSRPLTAAADVPSQSVASPAALVRQAARSGDVFVSHRSGGQEIVSRVTTAGTALFRDVDLRPGENPFVAVATDDSGNQSAPSLPASIHLLAATLPDLSVSSSEVLVVPALPRAGESLGVHATVRNLGGGSASAVPYSILLRGPSSSATGAAQNLVLEQGTLPVLAPGETVVLSLDLDSPVAGTQEVLVALDEGQALTELDETNNRAQRSFEVSEGSTPRPRGFGGARAL